MERKGHLIMARISKIARLNRILNQIPGFDPSQIGPASARSRIIVPIRAIFFRPEIRRWQNQPDGITFSSSKSGLF